MSFPMVSGSMKYPQELKKFPITNIMQMWRLFLSGFRYPFSIATLWMQSTTLAPINARTRYQCFLLKKFIERRAARAPEMNGFHLSSFFLRMRSKQQVPFRHKVKTKKNKGICSLEQSSDRMDLAAPNPLRLRTETSNLARLMMTQMENPYFSATRDCLIVLMKHESLCLHSGLLYVSMYSISVDLFQQYSFRTAYPINTTLF